MGFGCMFIRFWGGFVYVYAVYTFSCIFIGGTVNPIFYRSFVRGSGRLVGCCCWSFVAGRLLVGLVLVFLNLKESRCIKFEYIPLKIGGILHFFGVFRWSFSLRLVHLFTHNSKPYRLHSIPHPTTYPNGLPNGKITLSLSSP